MATEGDSSSGGSNSHLASPTHGGFVEKGGLESLGFDDTGLGGGPEEGWMVLGDAGGGGGFNAKAIKAHVDQLARWTTSSQGAGDQLTGTTAIMGALAALAGGGRSEIHTEDVVSAPSWAALCSCITSVLLRASSLLGSGSTSVASADLEQRASGSGAEDGIRILQASAHLLSVLVKEVVDTSPPHTAQLLRALVPFLSAPVPVVASSGFQGNKGGGYAVMYVPVNFVPQEHYSRHGEICKSGVMHDLLLMLHITHR
jgi:hypothetical protein